MRKYNVAVIGATGNTGLETVRTLESRKFPINEIHLIASENSHGIELPFCGSNVKVIQLNDVDFSKVDISFFCSTSDISNKYAEHAANSGSIVIDKTACFRSNPKVPLVVPEINHNALLSGAELGIISNPNCVAIPLCIAINALSKVANVKRVVASTYQSVSGAGKAAINELINQTRSALSLNNQENSLEIHVKNQSICKDIFTKPMAFNVIPCIGEIEQNGNSDEENKIIQETCKILQSDIKVAVTCVRVPVILGHSISVACEFDAHVSATQIHEAFSDCKYISADDSQQHKFTTPVEASGVDNVFISRIRKDSSVQNGVLLWITCDNLRKGAALNSVQIAESLVQISPSLDVFKKRSA